MRFIAGPRDGRRRRSFRWIITRRMEMLYQVTVKEVNKGCLRWLVRLLVRTRNNSTMIFIDFFRFWLTASHSINLSLSCHKHFREQSVTVILCRVSRKAIKPRRGNDDHWTSKVQPFSSNKNLVSRNRSSSFPEIYGSTYSVEIPKKWRCPLVWVHRKFGIRLLLHRSLSCTSKLSGRVHSVTKLF